MRSASIGNNTNTVPSNEMDVLAWHVNEEPEVPVDEELPDELVSVGEALEIKDMIDMKVLSIVASPTTKKVSDERWVLRRKRPETVGDGNMAREIAKGCSERRLCSYSHSCVQRSGKTMKSALNCQQKWIENQERCGRTNWDKFWET